MKRKFIDPEDYKKVIEPEIKISFGTTSPFPSLNFPSDKTKFIAWYGNTSFSSGTSIAIGTLEVCRQGSGTVLYDFDKYPIYTTGTPTIYEIVGPQKPDYHWASGLPGHLQDNAPPWVKEVISEKLGTSHTEKHDERE